MHSVIQSGKLERRLFMSGKDVQRGECAALFYETVCCTLKVARLFFNSLCIVLCCENRP